MSVPGVVPNYRKRVVVRLFYWNYLCNKLLDDIKLCKIIYVQGYFSVVMSVLLLVSVEEVLGREDKENTEGR